MGLEGIPGVYEFNVQEIQALVQTQKACRLLANGSPIAALEVKGFGFWGLGARAARI